MVNLRKYLIAHWIIYSISTLMLVLTGSWVSSLNAVPVWILGVVMTVTCMVLFGTHGYLFWSKFKAIKIKVWREKTKYCIWSSSDGVDRISLETNDDAMDLIVALNLKPVSWLRYHLFRWRLIDMRGRND